MSQYRITTPVTGYVGKVGEYAFADGRYDGEVSDAALAYFRQQGYGVQDLADAKKADAAEAKKAAAAAAKAAKEAAADSQTGDGGSGDPAGSGDGSGGDPSSDPEADAAGKHGAPDTTTGGNK